MTILGVTGGIGSGKSTVCRLIEERGARIFNSDEVARHLMVADQGVRSMIKNAFGAESYREDGSLDRSYLADRVFSSDEDRLAINGIVHPAVGRAFEAFVEQENERNSALIIKEAALLFESGTEDLDYVIVVDAPVEARLDRVMDRDQAGRDDILARMRSQMRPSDMRKRADFVIDNSGSTDDLVMAIDELLHTLGLTPKTNVRPDAT